MRAWLGTMAPTATRIATEAALRIVGSVAVGVAVKLAVSNEGCSAAWPFPVVSARSRPKATDGGEKAVQFTIGMMALIGLGGWLLYAAFGMAYLPMALWKRCGRLVLRTGQALARAHPPPPPPAPDRTATRTAAVPRLGTRGAGATHTASAGPPARREKAGLRGQAIALWQPHQRGEGEADSKNSQTTPATTSTAPTHQRLGSANAETTPARAPAAAADRK